MEISAWISLGSIIFVSAILALTSLKRAPGIGVLLAIVVIAGLTWLRGEGLAELGFVRPESWLATVLLSMMLGLILALASTLVIEPLTDRLAGTAIDHSLFDGIRGNLPGLLKLLLLVWVVVAFLEEIIFRGFLILELARWLGTGAWGLAVNLLFNSVLFGIAHWYQGRSGALSTGAVGMLIGVIFIAGGYNLWLPLLTHGFIDTFGLALVYLNGDRYLKSLVRGRSNQAGL